MVEEQFELLKFCHPGRVTRASDKWVLGAYNLQRLAYIPQVITSQHVYDTKAEVTTLIDRIIKERGEQERGWFIELQIDPRVLEFYDKNGLIGLIENE